jgi:PII-like signaling protein
VTDDIVTRLREKYLGQLPICIEAADEIERLQVVIQELVSEMHKIASAIHQVSAWFHNQNVPKSLNPDEEPF